MTVTAKKVREKPTSSINEIRDSLKHSLREIGITDPLYEGLQGTFSGGRMRKGERRRNMLDATLITAVREGISPTVVLPRRMLSDYLNNYAGYENFTDLEGGKNPDKQAA